MEVLPFPHFDSPNITRLAFPDRFPQTDQPVISPKVPRGMIPVGTTRDGRIYYIDASQSFRLLVIGPTGRGKTWVIRGLCDWLNLYNWLLLIVNDTANEMISSLKPNTKHELPPFAKPTANTRLRRWVAEWAANKHEPASSQFSLRVTDLRSTELQYLLSVTDQSPKQRMVLRKIAQYFERSRARDPNFKLTQSTLRQIRRDPSLIFDQYDAEDRTDREAVGEPLTNILYRMEELLEQGVIETDKVMEPLALIAGPDGEHDYRHLICDWSQVAVKDIANPESLVGTYISIVTDRLFEARKNYRTSKGKGAFIPPLFVAWDEAGPYIIKNSLNFPSRSMRAIYTQGRKEGVGIILGFQDVLEVDEVYLNNAEYAFIFAIAGGAELDTIRKAFPNIYPDNYQGRANLEALADIQAHEFLAIDRVNQLWQFVTAFPPLSKHLEEDTTK